MTINCICVLVEKRCLADKLRWPFSRRALLMRHPRLGGNEAAALNAASAVVLRAHLADRKPLFAHFPAHRFGASGHELRRGRREGLSHRPVGRVLLSRLRLRSRLSRRGCGHNACGRGRVHWGWSGRFGNGFQAVRL